MKTIFRYCLSAVFAPVFLASALSSCQNNKTNPDPEPPVKLTNQIEYNGETPIDIKSSIYEIGEDGTVSVYLSPTSGINGIEGMIEADDYLRISASELSVDINVDEDYFTIEYRDFVVGQDSKDMIDNAVLSAELDTDAFRLELSVDIVMNDGTTFRAEYDGTCSENYVEVIPLVDEFELDGERSSILSVVEWYNYKESVTEYCFYVEEGQTEPAADAEGLVIKIADGQSSEVDLGTVDLSMLSIVCGDFESKEGMTGTLSLSKDKISGNMVLVLDAEVDGKVLSARYDGDYVRGYESADKMTVTYDGTVYEESLSKVFLYSDGVTNVFAMGLASDAAAPADLMLAKYAVRIGISNAAIGSALAFPDDAAQCDFKVYDYETYTTVDINMASGSGATGSLAVFKEGDNVYISYDLTFPDGMTVSAEWYGPAVEVDEAFDITPVKPFVPQILATAPDGEVLGEWTIDRMEMRMEKDYRLRGGDPAYGGATFDAYFFYFVPEGEEVNVDDNVAVPLLMLRADMVPTGEEMDLASGENLNWSFSFQRSFLKYVEYTENYTMFGYAYGNCPDDVKVTAVRNEDNTWNFKFRMVDYNSTNGGSGNEVVIEWRGEASQYTGTKDNDMTEY